MKRLLLLVILSSLLLPTIGHCDERFSRQDLASLPIPKEYAGWSWVGGEDLAYYRDVLIPAVGGGRRVTGWTINASLGLLIGVGIFGEEAAAQVGTSVLISYLGNASTDITGAFIDWTTGNRSNPDELRRQVDILRKDLGISDHFIFAGLGRMGLDRMQFQIIPLGAWVILKIMPEAERPPILRLSGPEIDYQGLHARVIEKNLKGEFKNATIAKVFGYEVANGLVIRDTNNALWPLPVIPDSPSKGGIITGKIWLSSRPSIGYGGIREIHVSSPVNRGVATKQLDDYLLAIVLNEKTIQVRGLKSTHEVGKEVVIGIRVKGFHTGENRFVSSRGYSYNWDRLADAVFEGATCRGAGVSRTTIRHSEDRTYTEILCVPTKPGSVQVVMKTRDGELRIGESTVLPMTTDKKGVPDAGSLPSMQPQGRTARFDQPKIGGTRMDGCLYWAKDCGQPAADEFCKRNGFKKSSRWSVDEPVPESKIITSGNICQTGKNWRSCGAFSYIECQ